MTKTRKPRKPPYHVFTDSPDETTLRAAIHWLEKHREEGARCPCCTRVVKIYHRKIHREMVRFLARLQNACDQDAKRFFSPRALLPGQTKASTDATYLIHWDFIQRAPPEAAGPFDDDDDEDDAKRGHYRITTKGREWLAGRTMVSAAVDMICGRILRFDPKMVSAADAYGSPFLFTDLLLART